MNGHAEIAGGGFAGLATAIALAKSGWGVRIHERDVVYRPFGAGFFLWENGLAALAEIGLDRQVLLLSHAAPIYLNYAPDGTEVGSFRFGAHVGTRMINITRQRLHQLKQHRALLLVPFVGRPNPHHIPQCHPLQKSTLITYGPRDDQIR